MDLAVPAASAPEYDTDADYADRYVAFLDVLGFSELTRRAHDDPAWRTFLRGSIEILNRTLPNQVESTGFRFTQFSDSIVLSARAQLEGLDAVVRGCLTLSSNMLGRGLLLRGGIAHGKLHHDGQMLFGPALIDAYEFERRGGPPHISLDDTVHAALDLRNLPPGAADLVRDDPWDLSPMLHTLREFEIYDGVPVVGGVVLDRYAVELAAGIHGRATDMSLPPAVRAKWRWQQDYWNRSVAVHGFLPRSEPRTEVADKAGDAAQHR